MPESPPANLHPVTAVDRASKFTDFVVVTVCTLAFALNAGGILTSLLTDGFAGQRDFLTYWCSGVQLVHHQNPYGEAAIGTLERSVGFPPSLQPLIMRNAPYALVVVYPLGFFTLKVASLIWSVCMILAAWWSVRLIADTSGGRGKKANLLAIAFAPLLSCLISGQISLFALLGLSLFVRLVVTRPWLAGASLWLCAFKPQDFVPFGIVLFAWCVSRRAWPILLGTAVPLAASVAIVHLMDPHAWREYFGMMSAAAIPDKFIPSLSTMVRVAINPNAVWLQWLPMTGGSLWALFYLRRHGRAWDWRERTPLLILISIWTAPYSWFMDQSILLVALLPLLYRRISRPVIWSFVLISGLVEWANVFGVPLGSRHLYPWTATIWLGWYLWASRTTPPLDGSEAFRDPSQQITAVLQASGTTVTR